MYRDDITVGDIAFFDRYANTAAVDKRDIGAQYILIRIRAEIPKIRFFASDQTVLLLVRNDQIDIRLCNNCLDQCVIFRLDAVDKLRNICILVLCHVCADVFSSDRTVLSDDDLADVFKLRAGRYHLDGFSVFVLHALNEQFVCVTVQQRVDTRCIFDNICRGPRRARSVRAEVCDCDNIVSARLLCSVNSALYSLVQLVTGLVVAEVIDIVSELILEIGRGGLYQGLRGADAGKCNLLAAVSHHLIGIKHKLVAFHEVCGHISCFHLRYDDIEELIHAIVEFMVARNDNVIANFVHDIHQIFTLG